MTRKILKAKNIILKDRVVENRYLIIEDKKIIDIVDEIPEDEEFIDYSEYTLAPGFVDTHIHGYKNHDFMDKDKEAVYKISEGIVENGVTTFLATTLTGSEDDLTEVCKIVGENYDKVDGAKIAGIFLEGPFLSLKYKGAQNPKYLVDADIDMLKTWQEASGGIVRKIALAPEKKEAEDFIRQAKDMGVYVALGHSDASYEEAYNAVKAGANIFIHTYNAMSPLHHRKPGMVGAALSLDDVFTELICDGHHVHPAAAKVVMKARGKDEVVLITDCMMAGGMPDGPYKLGELDVDVKDGTARLKEGNLAGSILKLKDAVKNVVQWGIASPFEAIQMASQVPAMSIGIEDRAGIIDKGRFADIAVLDEDLDIVATFIDGELKYERK